MSPEIVWDRGATDFDLSGGIRVNHDIVYIPTLGRPENLRKVIPIWLEQEFTIRLVVERREYQQHMKLRKQEGWGTEVYVLPLPIAGRGIGYARNYIVKHAKNTALKSIIISDDDMYAYGDAYKLIDEAAKPGVLGIGSTRSIHDRFTGGAVSKNTGVILCPGGWGFQLFGLNVDTAIECGNFNTSLNVLGEDAELARHGIARGIPWRVHCDVKSVSIGKRYSPGGMNALYPILENRVKAERRCMEIIHMRWPEYTNAPDKKLRVAWQKMLDRYIPNWREASAIHGGSLDRLYMEE